MQMVVIGHTTKYNNIRSRTSTVVTLEPYQKGSDDDTKMVLRLPEPDDPRYKLGALVDVAWTPRDVKDERHEKD